MALLEICCGDIESVRAANDGGADRIELCSGLSDGGLTPSYGLIQQAVNISSIPVNILIRPRGGDFLYSPTEVETMIHDIKIAQQLGASGVVIGALTTEGNIDVDVCSTLIAHAKGLSVTFHRAFDMCRDPYHALEQIIALGCDRILTSGLSPTALDGVETLRRLHDVADGRIKILAGCGVSATNAREILSLGKADELHASARSNFPSGMIYTNPIVFMGAPDADEFLISRTDPIKVKDLATICHEKI